MSVSTLAASPRPRSSGSRARARFAELAHRIATWFEQNGRDLPWRRTTDPYAIWVSEIMLQQTQVKTVIPYWERWMARFPTIQALRDAAEGDILKAWEGLGYYSRVRNMHRAAREICERHGGKFPDDYDAILALSGIGRYTAGAIASMAFGQPQPILDGNVERVLSRVFAVRGQVKSSTVSKRLWRLSASLVRAVAQSNGRLSISSLNQGLMELGALVCLPRTPRCDVCPLRGDCLAAKRGQVSKFPSPPPKKEVRRRHAFSYVLRCGDQVLVRQRPIGQVNAGLWEFPTFESANDTAAHPAPLASLPLTPFHSVRHTITHHRIHLQSWQARVPKTSGPKLAKSLHAQWVAQSSLSALPFSSAQSKLRVRLLESSANPER